MVQAKKYFIFKVKKINDIECFNMPPFKVMVSRFCLWLYILKYLIINKIYIINIIGLERKKRSGGIPEI